MKQYHPKSWSQQARVICDNQITSINAGWQTIEGAHHLFSSCYRTPVILRRAAKRFGRMVRLGKVHEDIELYVKRYQDIELYVKRYGFNSEEFAKT